MSPLQWALYGELRHAQHLVYHLVAVAYLSAPAAATQPRRAS